MIKNKFKKMSQERLGRVIYQDLVDIIRLSPEFLKLKYPKFKHENLDDIKSRFLKDINKLYKYLTPEAQYNINSLISNNSQEVLDI